MWSHHQRRTPTSQYYRRWILSENEIRHNREVKRDIRQRALMRQITNPFLVNNTQFILRYRLSKPAFRYLCHTLRQKTALRASKRVSLELKVLCALLFYSSGGYQNLVGMGINLGQTTVSAYVKEVTDALTTPAILNTFIKFPNRNERDRIKNDFYTKFGLPGVIGCIDCSHFRIFTPKTEVEQLYYSRKHYHSINVQMICDSDTRILNVNAKFGGATHDAFVWDYSTANEFMQRLHENNELVWLLGDSGYPQRPWLMTPVSEAIEGSPEANYTRIHGQARVLIENTFGRLKNRFRCLCKDRAMHYDPKKCAKIIMACSVLHNIRIKFGVIDPEDQRDEDQIEEEEEEESEEEIMQETDDLLEMRERNSHVLIQGRALRNALINRLTR